MDFTKFENVREFIAYVVNDYQHVNEHDVLYMFLEALDQEVNNQKFANGVFKEKKIIRRNNKKVIENTLKKCRRWLAESMTGQELEDYPTHLVIRNKAHVYFNLLKKK